MYKFLQVGVVRPFVWLFFGARLKGQERIPRRGGAILAANHVTAGETVILPSLIHRRVAFLAKAELFTGDRGVVSKIVAWFMKAIDMVPVNRSGGRDTSEALQHAVDVLKDGGIIAMFPEGTRSPDGRMYKGKTGAARLALITGVPVIPIGLTNTKPKKFLGLRWYWRPLAQVGVPMTFDQYLGHADDRDTLRLVTDEIMAAIQQITGQQYVDLYASGVKHGRVSEEEVLTHVLPRPGFCSEAIAAASPETLTASVTEGGSVEDPSLTEDRP